jgi:hypothetical protein
MVRKLKHHEQKLLKKVDFIDWKDNNLNENKVMARYSIKKREEYTYYNKLSREVSFLKIRMIQFILAPRVGSKDQEHEGCKPEQESICTSFDWKTLRHGLDSDCRHTGTCGQCIGFVFLSPSLAFNDDDCWVDDKCKKVFGIN